MADVLLARALNATIGTPDFKGFNEIYEDNIKNVRLVGSEESFFVYDGGFTSDASSGETKTSKYITFDASGSANAIVYIRIYNSSSSSTGKEITVKVLDENEKTINEKSTVVSAATQGYASTEFKIPFNVYKTSKYKILASGGTSSGINNIRQMIVTIGASIVPATSFCTITD